MSLFFNTLSAAAAAKSLQSCPTLCNPIDGNPPGPPVPGILQARTLEWVAFSFSNAWKWKVKVKPLSPVRLFATPGTAAYQAPPSMRFSRQEYWSGVPMPSPIMFARFSSLNEYRSFIVTAVQLPIIWVYPDHLASPTLINPWVVSDISVINSTMPNIFVHMDETFCKWNL